MMAGDLLKEGLELFQQLQQLVSLRLLLDIAVIANAFLLCSFSAKSSKKLLRFFLLGWEDQTIEILDDSTDSFSSKHPLAVEDVVEFLEKVREKDAKALMGIERVIITNRPPTLHQNIMGSFTPKEGPNGGAVIRIFPLGYNALRRKYTLDFSEIGMMKIGYTEREAKDLLLFTLGHEIGHNVKYRRSGEMFGAHVEEFCDDYSENLGIVLNPETAKVGTLFHIEDPIPTEV